MEVANPMSIYPKYKATRSLFNPDPGKLDDFTVEVATEAIVHDGDICRGPEAGPLVQDVDRPATTVEEVVVDRDTVDRAVMELR